jgi:hypothetical protein
MDERGYDRDYHGMGGDHPNPQSALDVLEAGHAYPIPEKEDQQP